MTRPRKASLARYVLEHLEARRLLCADHELLAPSAAADTSPYGVLAAGDSAWDSHVYPTDQMKQAAVSLSAGPITQSAWSTGTKTVLYIRARFNDQGAAYEPQTLASATSMMDAVNTFMQANSWGATSFVTTYTPVYTLPHTEQWYKDNDTSGYAYNVLSDARSVAANPAAYAGNEALAAYNYNSYTLDAVRYNGGPGSFSGQAYVGWRGAWLKSSSTGVADHEFGHNLGLQHANYWDPTDDQTIIGPGANSEYGDPFDTMGPAGGGAQHYNAYEKSLLGWIPASNVTSVTANGTYRIYPFDLGGTFDATKQYALEILKDSDRDYWVDFRQNPSWSSNAWLFNGIELHWDPWASSNGGSQFLDTTPNTPDGKNDGAVVVGRTYADPVANIYITPIAKNATTPASMDVVVNFGSPALDSAPLASMSASATSVAAGVAVNFSASATDPDGDPLAYTWDFGDKTFSTTNSPAASKAWSTPSQYRVRLTVSDMRGKSSSQSILVTVGAPTATGTIVGFVRDIAGNPLPDVLVNNGLAITDANYRYAYTDADGSYALLNLASATTYTVNATRAGYTLTRLGWTNPVLATQATASINFLAAQTLYKILGKVTSDGTTPIAGAIVSDGLHSEPTDASGNYAIYTTSGPYTLSVTKPGYTFGAAVQTIVQFGDTTLNLQATGYYLSGSIIGAPAGLSIVVTDGVRSTTVTGGNGNYYSIGPVPIGTWHVSASATGYSFSPSGWADPLTITSAGFGNIDFTTDASQRYFIRGRLTHRGQALAGATVTAGASSAMTDSGGYYLLSNLAPGTYAITPSLAPYSFTPASTNVTVSSANVSGKNFATTAVDAAPTVATPAAASYLGPTTASLSVLGADDAGESLLIYTWSAISVPAGGSATFAPNADHAAASATATFTVAGSYTLRSQIKDSSNNIATSDVLYVVAQTLTALSLSPALATIALNATQAFAATARDQFAAAMSPQPAFSWSASGGGSISGLGLFTSSGAAGLYTVTASTGSLSTSAALTVTYPSGPGYGITRELFAGVGGNTVTNLTSSAAFLSNAPSSISLISGASTYLETPSNSADNYGQRIRGWLIAPASGPYTFYIASDDYSELWLSTDATTANKLKIASVSGATGSREWTKYASQQSAPITLSANQRYYVEVLHKEGTGSDYLAVRADLPGGIVEAPLPTHRLDPIPAVSITASDASASEPSPADAGSFLISLSSPAPVPVVVNYLVTGTATNGTDYSAIPTSITIPAGQTSLTITITPQADLLVEGVETVTLVLTANLAYLQGASTSASLTITDNTPPLAATLSGAAPVRFDAVSSLSINFNRPITGLDLADLTLTRDGGGNLLAGAQSLSFSDPSHFTLAGLAPLTAPAGNYLLTLKATASGISDTPGNPLSGDAVLAWFVTPNVVITGTPGADTFRLSRNPADPSLLDAYANSPTPTWRLFAATLSSLVFSSGDGDDLFTFDGASGAPAAAGLTFDGGQGTDTVSVAGSGSNDVASTASGQLTLNGAILAFSQIEAVGFSTGAGDDTLNLNAAVPGLTFSGGTGLDTLNVNAGAAVFDTDTSLTTANLTLNISSAAVFHSTQHLAGINIGPAATLTAAPGTALVRTASLSILAGGRFDLNAASLIVDYGTAPSPRDELAARIASARNGRDALEITNWTGPGLTSSSARSQSVLAGFNLYTLGLIDNADLAIPEIGRNPYTAFAGELVSAHAILARLTWAGDADLNGQVDGDDYALIDNVFNGLVPKLGFLSGDLNADGNIDVDDYALIDSSFLFQGAPLFSARSDAIDSLRWF